MSHLDEGTLHAMLDGELEAKEVAEIKAHVAACTSCGLRLREVQEFLDEADRLVSAVHMDAGAAPLRRFESGAAEPPDPVRSGPVEALPDSPRPRPVPERPVATETWNAPPPPLLMPDNESAADRRMRRVRKYGWAAMILVFVGAGVVGVQMREPPPGFERRVGASPSAVVSPEETSRDAASGDSAPTELAKAPSTPAPAKSSTAAASRLAAPAPSGGKAASRDDADAVPTAALARRPDRTPRAEQGVADRTAAAAESSGTVFAAADEAAGPDDSAADTIGSENLVNVREKANEALADLDRERRRNQAAAATAALDSQRRRQAARAVPSNAGARGAQVAPAAAAPAPPPAPPTLEQRAQIYLRIGLDEAARQLGGPAHVIEGMSAMFTGLAQGVVVPGADATRPVVRVVYQDSQGRLIMLDQQRMRPGQPAPQGSPLGWTIGETAVWLHGEAGPDVLRLYRPRVR